MTHTFDSYNKNVAANCRAVANVNLYGTWEDPVTGRKLYNQVAVDEMLAEARAEQSFSKVNRVEVVDFIKDLDNGGGRTVIVWQKKPLKVELSLQDDDRTLKILVSKVEDQAERLKQQGIEASYQYADLDWKKIAADAVRKFARTMPEFSSDDVWVLIAKTGVTTSNNSAFGAIMQSAHRSGMIKATPHFLPSKRKILHKRPIRLWQSLIYQPNGRQE